MASKCVSCHLGHFLPHFTPGPLHRHPKKLIDTLPHTHTHITHTDIRAGLTAYKWSCVGECLTVTRWVAWGGGWLSGLWFKGVVRPSRACFVCFAFVAAVTWYLLLRVPLFFWHWSSCEFVDFFPAFCLHFTLFHCSWNYQYCCCPSCLPPELVGKMFDLSSGKYNFPFFPFGCSFVVRKVLPKGRENWARIWGNGWTKKCEDSCHFSGQVVQIRVSC